MPIPVYMIKKGNDYCFQNPFYKEIEKITCDIEEYINSNHFNLLHCNFDSVKEVINNLPLSIRSDYRIVKIEYVKVETIIDF